MQDLKNIIESLLFVTDEPLSLDRLKTTLESTDGKEIRQALQLLHEDYEQRGGGFYLREVAGGWQLRSRAQYHEWIRRLLQPTPQRLSKAALETLAIIAYKQPIIRADIEFIRGVDCGGVLRQLMERKLIRVLGRKEIAGRPLIYATTKLFLELFDLKDLKDLPSPKEIAELTNDRPSDSDQGVQDPAAISDDRPSDSDQEAQDPAAISDDRPSDVDQEAQDPAAISDDRPSDADQEAQDPAAISDDRPSDSDQEAQDPAAISETVPDLESDPESNLESNLESEPEQTADESPEGFGATRYQAPAENTQVLSTENEHTGDKEILDGDNPPNQDKQVDDKDIQINNA